MCRMPRKPSWWMTPGLRQTPTCSRGKLQQRTHALDDALEAASASLGGTKAIMDIGRPIEADRDGKAIGVESRGTARARPGGSSPIRGASGASPDTRSNSDICSSSVAETSQDVREAPSSPLACPCARSFIRLSRERAVVSVLNLLRRPRGWGCGSDQRKKVESCSRTRAGLIPRIKHEHILFSGESPMEEGSGCLSNFALRVDNDVGLIIKPATEKKRRNRVGKFAAADVTYNGLTKISVVSGRAQSRSCSPTRTRQTFPTMTAARNRLPRRGSPIGLSHELTC